MTFSKQQIIGEMKRSGIVPLYTADNLEEAFQVVKTSYDAGIRVFEFTNRRTNSFDIFKHLLSQRSAYADLMLGIGTIMDEPTTKKFIDAGADFIISPILKIGMAEVCHQHDKMWIPGCATLTEIVTAKEHGAEVIKVFPGSVLGPSFVSSIMAVVPGLQLMITGGVEPTQQSLSAWFNAGAFCVGMGSQLFTKDIVQQHDWASLKRSIAQAQWAIDYLLHHKKSIEHLPDVILLDIYMPELDGWGFLQEYQRIKDQLGKSIDIYIISSSGHPKDRNRAEAFPEVKAYLQKPITKEQLMRHIVLNESKK